MFDHLLVWIKVLCSLGAQLRHFGGLEMAACLHGFVGMCGHILHYRNVLVRTLAFKLLLFKIELLFGSDLVRRYGRGDNLINTILVDNRIQFFHNLLL